MNKNKIIITGGLEEITLNKRWIKKIRFLMQLDFMANAIIQNIYKN